MSLWDQHAEFLAEEAVELWGFSKRPAIEIFALMRSAYEEALYQTQIKLACLTGRLEIIDAPQPYQTADDPLPAVGLYSVKLAAFNEVFWGTESRTPQVGQSVPFQDHFEDWCSNKTDTTPGNSSRFEVQRFSATEINRWLKTCGIKAKDAFSAQLSSVSAGIVNTQDCTKSGVANSASNDLTPLEKDWKAHAWDHAVAYTNQIKHNSTPNLLTISDHVAKKLRAEGITTSTGKPPSGAYIKRHALRGFWNVMKKEQR